MDNYFIQPQSGIRINVNKGQKIEIIDVDGGQVADFFAEIKGTHDEYVSPSVTIDCNESLKIEIKKPLSKAGDKIVLLALVDCVLGISACSVSECDTNSGNCTAIAVNVR